MIGQRRVLAVIPARGGSKGLPGKNILPVEGKPLIGYTIDAAHSSGAIDRTILSSDDQTIMAAAQALGCDVPFCRPDALATDTATTVDVILHALDALPGYDVVMVLQPTSPLRTSSDIDEACRIFSDSGAPACVSVSPVEQSPYWMYTIGDDDRLRPVVPNRPATTRRQDLPTAYAPNGAIYIADVAWFREQRAFITEQTVPYVMPLARSVDIDNADDFAEFKKKIAQGMSGNNA